MVQQSFGTLVIILNFTLVAKATVEPKVPTSGNLSASTVGSCVPLLLLAAGAAREMCAM